MDRTISSRLGLQTAPPKTRRDGTTDRSCRLVHAAYVRPEFESQPVRVSST